jgi:5-methyltetrahydropteroyltriglutamate--homocysteine methyltransferase
LINQVIAGVEGLRIGIHVCRGNWSRQEEVLLSGDYDPLLPAFKNMQVGQFVLEFSTPRAGEIDVVGAALANKEIGLGVVNPRTAQVESTAQIVQQVERALSYYSPQAIFLNPDCGFGTFANRCVNDHATALAKMKQLVLAARQLREKYS